VRRVGRLGALVPLAGLAWLAGLSAGTARAEGVPVHPYLARSAWPMTHANTYNQDSTDTAGPTTGKHAMVLRWDGGPVPITLAVSSPYADGARVIWGNTRTEVTKWVAFDGSAPRRVGSYPRPVASETEISGAYSLVDSSGRFFVPRDLAVDVFADTESGVATSAVRWHGLELGRQLRGLEADERFVGLSLTYDGMLATVTSRGLVVVASREGAVLATLRLDGALEVSNSLAVDETGGIYVVTHRFVHKVQWTGERLAEVWRTAYPTDDFQAPGRIGKGSGTSPTLMGSAADDRFVVIADGQRAMHVLFVWRDEVPASWRGLPGRDRRIAADLPVTFGKGEVTKALTEQSIVVSGTRALLVDNSYGKISRLEATIAKMRGADVHLATIYLSNSRHVAPFGVELFEWSAATQSARSVWARPDVSCPNGIPSMSRGAALAYCLGQRQGRWTVEAMDWETGATRFSVPLSKRADDNSFYAGLEVVGPGVLMTGTYGGALSVQSK
jgi:hypothetical protein